MESLNSNSQERELHQLQLEERQMHSTDMACFKGLEAYLKTLSDHEEHQTFRMNMFDDLDQLHLQFENENLHAVNAKTCLEVLKYGELWMKECEVKTIKETEKSLNEAILHEHEIEISFKLKSKHVQINPVQAVDANLVITKSSGIELENNSLENALSKLVNETQMQMQEGKVDIVDCMMVVKEIEDGLLEEMEKFGWWFEQDIGGESEDDREKRLVMVSEEGWMS
ncbi:hypothetical protein Tco_0394695 [Tanacetum coccineum]